MLIPKIPRPSWAIAVSRKMPRIQVAIGGLPSRISERSPVVATYGITKKEWMKKTEVGRKRAELTNSSTHAYFSYAFSLLTDVTPTTPHLPDRLPRDRALERDQSAGKAQP